MDIGASSACFYPLETGKSFQRIAELGFSCSEIFFNSSGELNSSFIRELKQIKDAYGTQVVSLHPYRSFSEGYDFFSCYKRRFSDALEGYKRYFDAAGVLGAKYIVMHGAKGKADICNEEYAERFGILSELAESYGCYVAHENVVNFVSQSVEFMSFMKETLGDKFKMVLDVKQATRTGVDPEEFIDAVGENIVHVHLSDFNCVKDCVAPSQMGGRDFEKLFRQLENVGYKGKYIIELYSDGYENSEEIVQSARYLEAVLDKVRQGG